jgi:hypothetical protein
MPVGVSAAIVLLADQPTMPIAMIDAALAAPTDRPLVACRDQRGAFAPPVLMRRDGFGLVTEVVGDAGLRAIIAGHPELVTAVDVAEHAPDIDTAGDVAALGDPCPGCGAILPPNPAGPRHPYIGAAPACWMAFGEIEAKEFGIGGFGRLHRHTVDAYATQHPGVDGRRERQSIAIHLIGLCHWLEHGLPAPVMTPITQRLTADKREWPWLEPPTRYDMTALDVLPTTHADGHIRLVRLWAESVWESWSAHHRQVRAWADESLVE